MSRIILVMGVSGSGKSTVAKVLARKLNLQFFDADDYHPPSNIDKMSKGVPLNDNDRMPWLHKLNDMLKESSHKGVVLACSALKESYREILRSGIDLEILFLNPSKETLKKRMADRKGHFMPESLLNSQLTTLEIPMNSYEVISDMNAENIADGFLRA